MAKVYNFVYNTIVEVLTDREYVILGSKIHIESG